jgi:serine/threonine protein kinase
VFSYGVWQVLEGNGYGKAVDWWSFGTLMFEMLTGLPPFYSQDVQVMYQKIMTAKLVIPVRGVFFC